MLSRICPSFCNLPVLEMGQPRGLLLTSRPGVVPTSSNPPWPSSWEGGKGGGKGAGNCTPCAHHRQGLVFPFPLLHPSFPSTPRVPSRTLCWGCSLIPHGSEGSGGGFLQEPTFPGKHRLLRVPLPAPHWLCLSGVQGTDVPPAAGLKPVRHSLAAPSSMLL